MDVKNNPKQHLIVGVFSLALVIILHYLLDLEWAKAFARTSFILLFLIMIIGPLTRIKTPTKSVAPLANPWRWRGELGIWFFLTALLHFILLLTDRSLSTMIKLGGSGYSLTNFIGLVALIITLLLAISSFGKVISWLGVRSWQRLHGLTHVVFYLVSAHYIYFQFFSTYGRVGPDWFGWMAITMTIIAILLQIIAFIKIITKQDKRKDVH
jgi:methionine sulfoxide reductase heme-binding subunit